MPSLNILSPGVPTLLTGLSPIAVAPVAPVEGAPAPNFSNVIAGFTVAAGPPLKPSVGMTMPPERVGLTMPPEPVGMTMPPERQDVAGSPEPLPPVEVENVMLGSGGSLPARRDIPVESPVAVAADTVTVPDDTPIDTAPPADAPIACGLQIWKRDRRAILTLPREVGCPLPFKPVQLPPQEAPDLPAADPDPAPTIAAKKLPDEPKPPILADAPAAAPPSFAAVSWTPPAPAPDRKPEAQPESKGESIPASAAPAPPNHQASRPKLEVQPQSLPTAIAPAPPTHGFSLPPEAARELAEFVRAAAGRVEEGAPDTAPPADTASLPPLPQAAPAAPAPHPGVAVVHRPAIDTGRAEWLQAMIERIAEMPQVDGKREAQIRLVPDALGPVEVKIVERNDRVHVTLHAETREARQLLTDAAPRLQELAEARGLKLSQGSFGAGQQQDRRPAPDHQPATPLRPRRAHDGSADTDSETPGDLIA